MNGLLEKDVSVSFIKSKMDSPNDPDFIWMKKTNIQTLFHLENKL